MNEKDYGKLYVDFLNMDKKAQCRFIYGIAHDKALDYEQTKIMLSFFILRSCLSQFGKLRLFRRTARLLKSKRAVWCRQNNVRSRYDSKCALRQLQRSFVLDNRG